MIPDHLFSRSEPSDDVAWLVDSFGRAHPVAPRTVIGRDTEQEMVVLTGSVSREHAELKKVDGGWQIRDLGSKNDTFVDGVRCQGRVPLPQRALVKVGDVAMWFVAKLAYKPTNQESMPTATPNDALLRYLLAQNETEMCVVCSSDRASGGSLLHRPKTSTENWGQKELPPLEFQLLRTLCAAAVAEADSPAAARGCVATRQLARDLPFQAKFADEENVRQVVRRLRAALTEIGADGALAVVPGRGYYLACPVTVSGAASDRR